MIINSENINEFIKDDFLDLYNLGVVKIESIPDGVVRFHCSCNLLTSLPELPDSLEYFYCYNNKLTELPHLPKNLKEMDCSDNLLTNIPKIPTSVRYLSTLSNPLKYDVNISNIKEHNKIIKRKEILNRLINI